MPEPLERREFLTRAAGSMAAVGVATYAARAAGEENTSSLPTAAGERPMSDVRRMQAISSANGLAATKKAYEAILAGTDALDAVVQGVAVAEDDPDDLTVGYGGLPNEDGIVELDAAVMHGPTHRCGAVASVRGIRHVARLAQLVMEQTDHVLLVGEGALRFARAQGFVEENLLTEKARRIWLYWKQTLSEKDDWIPPPIEKLDPEVVKFFKLDRPAAPAPGTGTGPAAAQAPNWRKVDRPTGTIHCAAMDARGDISCTTTTSGLGFKIAGRVGDSPIVGAGLYVDNEIGSCGSTGRGEANLQNLSSFAAVELMRNGKSPEEAGLEVLRRVAKHTEKRLLDAEGRPEFNLKFYLLSKDGRRAGVTMWGPESYAVTDAQGTRLEPAAFLYRKG